MKRKKWTALLAATLLMTTIGPAANAAEQRTIADESVYDLLVDRFFNYTDENNYNVDFKNQEAFNGGDLLGVKEKLSYIKDMGFTVINLGPIFETERYDGRLALSYEGIDKHFGTAKDLKALVDAAHKQDMKVTVDFPINGVSAQHVLASNDQWAVPNGDGTIDWNLSLPEVREALTDAASRFVATNQLDGIRLVGTEGVDSGFLNDLIAALKKAESSAYVMGNGETGANFDLSMNSSTEDILRETFVAFDQPSKSLNDLPEAGKGTPAVFVDTPDDSRFTYDIVSKRMFPPTRWHLISTALMTLPGTPVMQYGTEIAVNGEKAPDTHPILNFKADDELIKHLSNLNELRNKSAALRTGQFEMLWNKDGMIVYKRWDDKDTWIIAINNTSETQHVDLTAEEIGKEGTILRGLLDGDIVRASDKGVYRIGMDRETAELYIVNEDRGINKGYIAALILVWVLFVGFLATVWKQGRKRRIENKR